MDECVWMMVGSYEMRVKMNVYEEGMRLKDEF